MTDVTVFSHKFTVNSQLLPVRNLFDDDDDAGEDLILHS